MRRWLIGVSALAALIGSSIAGCSSDNTPSGGDAGNDGTTTDAAGDHATTDAAKDAGMEAAACDAAPVNVSSFDSGSSSWACVQAMCDPDGGLTQCGADCVCNSAIYAALQCGQTVDSGSAIMNCFTNALGGASTNTAVVGLISCLTASAGPCAGIVVDGGEAGTEAGGGEAGEAGGDAPTDSAPDGGTDAASDAPADGG